MSYSTHCGRFICDTFGPFFQRRELPKLFQEITLPPNARILEIGCGNGHALKIIQNVSQPKELFGIDVDGKAIERAQRLLGPSAKVSVGDATALQFENSSLDVVFSVTVLHHVALWQKAILETGRVLKTRGMFILLEPVEEALRVPLVKLIDRPEAIFSKDEVVEALEGAGFAIKILRWRGWYRRWIKASILCVAEKK